MSATNLARSMTGYASLRGQSAGVTWVWDIRSVNGKGLDLRLRLPDGIDGLEPAVRAAVVARVQRGNLSLGLKLARDQTADGFAVQQTALTAALAALAEVESRARAQRLALAPVNAADILMLRGVLDTRRNDDDDSAILMPLMLADLARLLDDFDAMRAAEGAALVSVLLAQVQTIQDLTAAARQAATARRDHAKAQLAEDMARILGTVPADPARIAQELALMAVKADVAEELDRLDAHCAAARSLLASAGPLGRKLDFLTQEFNREANTLCSKAQALALTQIGLDLKHVIDQMREQVQNLE